MDSLIEIFIVKLVTPNLTYCDGAATWFYNLLLSRGKSKLLIAIPSIVDKQKRQTVFLWIFVALLSGSTLLLAGLQYRWINEVSTSERDRRQRRLQADIERVATDFDSEVTGVATALALNNSDGNDESSIETAYARNFETWRESAKHEHLVSRMMRLVPNGMGVTLREFDPGRREFKPGTWPMGWDSFRQRLEARLLGEDGRPGPLDGGTLNVLEFPRWGHHDRSDGGAVREWLAVELDLSVVQKELIPELLQQHLGSSGPMEYEAEITKRGEPALVVYSSSSEGKQIGSAADATTQMFRLRMQRGGPRGFERSGARGGGRGNGELGRWLLSVRHKQGSLEAAVGRARTRNLALTTGILALMLLTIGALVWLTQRAQQLAYLQMEFVAGVSHELRTPLTVIGTAAFNMGSGIVKFNNQAQLERYGTLIQDQTKKLGGIVEQVLRFAGSRSEQTQWKKEVVLVEQLIDDALSASAQVIGESGCRVERDLPSAPFAVLGDATALQHVLQNLIANAAKYGATGGWIGISAAPSADKPGQVEICVADKGMGISKYEAGQIFEPFFRGKKAVEDQIHGTGLGLSLAKRIVEGNAGNIFVKSEIGKGSQFIVRLPAASKESMIEFANPIG